MYPQIHLQQRFVIGIFGAEDIDDETTAYDVALCAEGMTLEAISLRGDVRLIAGTILGTESSFTVDRSRPIKRSNGICEANAVSVLEQAFHQMQCGQSYDPDSIIVVPIDLEPWLARILRIHAITVEAILRAEVIANNFFTN